MARGPNGAMKMLALRLSQAEGRPDNTCRGNKHSSARTAPSARSLNSRPSRPLPLQRPLAPVVPGDAIEIEAPVSEIARRAGLPRHAQIRQSEVRKRNRLGVGRRIGRHTITCKREITRRQDATLRIMDVHILHVGQIPDDT